MISKIRRDSLRTIGPGGPGGPRGPGGPWSKQNSHWWINPYVTGHL